MELDDIITNMQNMDNEELFKLLGDIRLSRRTSKKPAGKAKATSASTPANVNLDSLLSGMSKDNMAALLAMLEGGNDNDTDPESGSDQ
jgi:hypothetical protein